MNWRDYVRSHLPPLTCRPSARVEIVEELAVQLESTYERARDTRRERRRGASTGTGRNSRLGGVRADPWPNRTALRPTTGGRRRFRGTS